MLKILSQILIVILAVGLVAGATYLLVNQTSNSTSFSSDRPALDASGTGPGNGIGPGDGGGMRGSEGERAGSSQAWLEVLKNVGIVAGATTLIALIRLMVRRKPNLHPATE
jgi:hypothetical protein